MNHLQAVVLILPSLQCISAIVCYSYARNEYRLEKIFDYGLVECPEGVVGCLYYQHRKCIEETSGIVYSFTGCLGNPKLCPKDKIGNEKLDETARCCYHDGCNLAIYKYMTALPKDVSQQFFVDSKECEEVAETTHASSSTASTSAYTTDTSTQVVTDTEDVDVVTEPSSSDMSTVAEASTETREDSTVDSIDVSATSTADSTEANTTESSVTETSPDEQG